jgi:hypothetical protein
MQGKEFVFFAKTAKRWDSPVSLGDSLAWDSPGFASFF